MFEEWQIDLTEEVTLMKKWAPFIVCFIIGAVLFGLCLMDPISPWNILMLIVCAAIVSVVGGTIISIIIALLKKIGSDNQPTP